MIKNDQYTVSDYYAEFFATQQVPAVFQLSGGMIAFLADAIHRRGITQIITNRNEQASGFAAEGATRITGRTSIALGTSGPGATNLVTPIASCYFDSTPALFITGQVNTGELKSSNEQRQNGFQELDIAEMVRGVTKAIFTPRNVEQAIEALHNGWQIANSGRFGPVLIDLPIDIQQMKVERNSEEFRLNLQVEDFTIKDESFTEILSLLSDSKNPLIMVGGGVRLDNSSNLVLDFARKNNIPMVSTLMGLDSVDHEDSLYLGFIGSYGNRWANAALSRSDLLIAFGCRLDPRQTGGSPLEFKTGKKIIRVDIDANELDGRVVADVSVKSRIRDFLQDSRLIGSIKDPSSLRELVNELKSARPQEGEQEFPQILNPNRFIQEISYIHRNSKGYIVDVGQHQMWAAQSLRLSKGQRFLTSGGLGAMGFSIPAAIGAGISQKGQWVVILGDGCAQLSSPELQTLKDLDLDVVIYVLNNLQHGMVAQFQDEYMDSRYVGTRFGYSVPPFSELAKLYGFKKTMDVNSIEDLSELENIVLNSNEGPMLVNVNIAQHAKALPKFTYNPNKSTS